MLNIIVLTFCEVEHMDQEYLARLRQETVFER